MRISPSAFELGEEKVYLTPAAFSVA